MKKLFLAALCTFSFVCASMAADKASEAIVTLLNSRASGSRSEFKEAAKIVAAGAKEGRPLQRKCEELIKKYDYKGTTYWW